VCSILSPHFVYKTQIRVGQNVSSMANYKSAQHSLLVLSRDCEQKMQKKVEWLASCIAKLAALRKDTTEKRMALVEIMHDHEKYINALQVAHKDAITNALPVVANMDQHTYTAGSWKTEDAYACDCHEFNYEHGCKGKGHFGWSRQVYVFTPVGWKTRNVH